MDEQAVASPPAPARVSPCRSAGARADDLDHSAAAARSRWWVGGLCVALLITLPLSVGIGPVAVAPDVVLSVLGHHVLGWPHVQEASGVQDAIVWELRAPRALLAAVVGAGLAASGAALQAIMRNVLADPYIIGVSSGASTGAAAAILFGVGIGVGASALSFSAFAGALLATGAVFLIARTGGRVTSTRLLLAGVTVGYLFYAATSFLIFASDDPEGARSVLFWLLGSLALAHWSLVLTAAVVLCVALGALLAWGRRLDAVAIGDETALSLGINPSRFRAQVLIVVALCVGVLVAAAGSIGFVGLVVPHLARRFVGGTHRLVIPVAAGIGALFLVWADVLARTVLQPQEVPIGIITALFGAPFLLLLVRRFHPVNG